MLIVPAINCLNFKCVAEKLKKAVGFFNGLPTEALAKEGWVQLDIADGRFTRAPEPPAGGSVRGFAPHKTWNRPSELTKFLEVKPPKIGRFNLPYIEIHLMVRNPMKVIAQWIKTGAKRIIVHLEAIRNANPRTYANTANILKSIFQQCRANKIEIGLAINPETPVEKLIPYLITKKKLVRVSPRLVRVSPRIGFIQLLAVKPGLAGQKFQSKVLEKIKFLKKNFPKVTIEVDGGINLRTAKLCKKAGADILATASYIWDSADPAKFYKKLIEI